MFSDLLHTVKTSDLLPDVSLLTLSCVHCEIKDIQLLCFHRPTEQISQHPSPASHIHTNASKRNSPVTDYIHCLKTQAFFLRNVHKTPNSYCGLVSLEFFCSSLAKYQAQRKVLTFIQTLLANKTSHRYVY
jgi:hypothetical protein